MVSTNSLRCVQIARVLSHDEVRSALAGNLRLWSQDSARVNASHCTRFCGYLLRTIAALYAERERDGKTGVPEDVLPPAPDRRWVTARDPSEPDGVDGLPESQFHNYEGLDLDALTAAASSPARDLPSTPSETPD